MFDCLETEHLFIREFKNEDIEDVLIYTGDSEVMRYLPENPFNKDDVKEFLRKNIYEKTENLPIILKSEGKLIGHIVFHSWYEPCRTWEIGWVFNKEYHGRVMQQRQLEKFWSMALKI